MRLGELLELIPDGVTLMLEVGVCMSGDGQAMKKFLNDDACSKEVRAIYPGSGIITIDAREMPRGCEQDE